MRYNVSPVKLGRGSTRGGAGRTAFGFRPRLRNGDAGHIGGRPPVCARRRGDQCAHRRARDRSHRRRRTPSHRGRPAARFGRTGTRRHHPTHGRARARGQHQLGGVRARQFRRRADRAPHRRTALPHGRLGCFLARPRPLARRQHHLQRRASRPPGQRDRRHLPRHSRSRERHDLRARAAHGQAQPALSVGAGSLQGQGQQHHALPRHRDRDRRPARLVPDHPVRGQGLDHVPRRRSARLGGAGLHRHRLRILGQGVRAVAGYRADLARVGRGDPGGDAGRVPVRLSQPQSLARTLRPHYAGLARLSRHAGRARTLSSPPSLRGSRASRSWPSPCWASSSWSICRSSASIAPCC